MLTKVRGRSLPKIHLTAAAMAIAVGVAGVGCSGSSDSIQSGEDQVVEGDAATAEQSALLLRKECGERPAGLAPKFETIEREDGAVLNVATQGSRNHPPLVLLHGFPDSWCGWARVMPELAKDYFVVAPDLRGYNRSSKPGTADPKDVADYLLPKLIADVDAIITFAQRASTANDSDRDARKHRDKPVLVAHDWGAIVAWQYAKAQGSELPNKIDRMVAVSVPHPVSMSLMLGTPAAKVLSVANASTRQLDFGPDGNKTLGEWITLQAASSDDAAKLAFIGAQQQAQGAALGYTKELVALDAYENFSRDNFAPFFDRLKTKLFRDTTQFLSSDEQAAHVRMWTSQGESAQNSFQAMAKYYRANLGATPLPLDFAVGGVPLLYIAPRFDGAINYPWGTLGLESVVPNLQVKTVETGHFVQREAPSTFVSLVKAFSMTN